MGESGLKCAQVIQSVWVDSSRGSQVQLTPLFVGSFELVVDIKSRLSIPSAVRELLDPEQHGKCLFLVVGLNKKAWIYTEREYERLAAEVPAGIAPGKATLVYRQVTFALSSRVELDKNGRILIPDSLKKRTGLRSEVTLFGCGNHLEIWDRAEFEAFINAEENQIDIVSEAVIANIGAGNAKQ